MKFENMPPVPGAGLATCGRAGFGVEVGVKNRSEFAVGSLLKKSPNNKDVDWREVVYLNSHIEQFPAPSMAPRIDPEASKDMSTMEDSFEATVSPSLRFSTVV